MTASNSPGSGSVKSILGLRFNFNYNRSFRMCARKAGDPCTWRKACKFHWSIKCSGPHDQITTWSLVQGAEDSWHAFARSSQLSIMLYCWADNFQERVIFCFLCFYLATMAGRGSTRQGQGRLGKRTTADTCTWHMTMFQISGTWQVLALKSHSIYHGKGTLRVEHLQTQHNANANYSAIGSS